MALSRAAHRLREVVAPKPEQMNQARVAAMCGVSQQAVSNWVRGAARPSPEAMAVIERELGIPMREWLDIWDDEMKTGTGTDG